MVPMLIYTILCNRVKISALRHSIALTALLLTAAIGLRAQSGLYIPSAKPIKNIQKAFVNPERFCLLLTFDGDQPTFREADLDLLDSAYRIAFDLDNPRYYTMLVESYADGDLELGRRRAASVMRYFADRSRAPFPIRFARNPIHCSCHGDTTEILRFEVPAATEVYDCSQLPEARMLLNKSIQLRGTVLVTFRHDPDECLGTARGCFTPAEDSLVRGYYAQLFLARGSVYTLEGTKDTCPEDIQIKIDDHLGYREIIENYSLIPHPKQLLVNAGYIVITSNFSRQPGECEVEQKDSILIRIPATQEQVDAKLRFFAKVQTSRGIEYKALPTRKMPGKGALMLQAPLNVSQLDTIFLGKRIQEDELKKYFYPVDSPTEASAFTVGRRHYVPYRVDRQGDYELKKPLRALFRIAPEQEEDLGSPADKRNPDNPEEIID